MDYLYRTQLRPEKELAEKYGVGIMITETTQDIFSSNNEKFFTYTEAILKGFNKEKLAWCAGTVRDVLKPVRKAVEVKPYEGTPWGYDYKAMELLKKYSR